MNRLRSHLSSQNVFVPGRVVVLGYHKVGPIGDEGRRLNVEPSDLGKQIRFFQRRGYRFLRAEELVDHPEGNAVCLTFDDAYLSFAQHGVEAISREEVTGTTYAVTGKVGRSSDWDGEAACPLANWSDLEQVKAAGIEIGNHTVGHRRLAELGIDEQREEIAEAWRELSMRGFEGGSFCYPYGSYGGETPGIVREAGYRVAVTVEKGVVGPGDDRLRLKRVMMAYSDRVAGLWYKVFVKPLLKGSR